MTAEAGRPSRRAVLRGGLLAAGGAGVALGGQAIAAAGSGEPKAPAAPDAAGRATVAFRGDRQPGVGTTPQAFATLVALDLAPGVNRDALIRLMRIWTDDAERLMSGRPALADTEPELAALPSGLTVTVGYGPAVFSAAGLPDARPSWLVPLPAFPVDRLLDRWSGGDLVLQVCADDELAVAHAARMLVKDARAFASVRWTQRGFRHPRGITAPGATMRNLMGQVDGTRNPDPVAEPDLVWQRGPGPWLSGGTSMVVRRISMDLDRWDAVDRGGREAAIGRRLADGAPLTGSSESDVPDLDARDARGFTVIGVAAHVRRAAPTTDDERFLRRPYSYLDPPDAGLLFVTFQADPVRQLLPVQRRIAEADLLNLWTTPIGSAVFAVPPGAADGEHLGQTLLG